MSPVRAARRGAAAALAVLLAGGATPAAAFLDGPPARVTGGFGEDSCESCHFGNPENDAVGALRLHGFPSVYEAGRTYELRVELSRPDVQAAGFQMAVRHADNRAQAGTLRAPASADGRVRLTESRDTHFAHHGLAGTRPKTDGRAVWTLLWTAPDAGGRVLAHASAVAADGDGSQAGDFVYTIEVEALPDRE